MDRKSRYVVADTTGGRNGIDPPTSPKFAANQVEDAVNVDWWQTPFARKRNGSSASGVSFASGGPFTGKISTLIRHVPGTDPTAAEEWAFDDAATPVVGRKAAATTFTAPTLEDALTGNGWDVSGASIDGKLFLAYKSGQARLHCWDPAAYVGSPAATVRRAGLAAPSTAPSVADTASVGTYPATTIYVRARVAAFLSAGGRGIVSEPSAVTTFTPSGANTGIVISRPTLPGEAETNWIPEASTDNVTFFDLGSTPAVATASITMTTLPTAFAALTVSALTGTYTLHKSYKYLAADQNRLLGFGCYTTTEKQNRVWFSAVVGSSDIGDAERLDTTGNYFKDLDENDSGAAMGLFGPLFGNFYPFKDRQIWELSPTGTTTSPYNARAISKVIGLVAPKAAAVGEDAAGNPALYFMSHRGPYRYGALGLEYLGHGVEDLVLGPTSTINLAAAHVVAHSVYHADKRQWWVWWATGSSDDPDTLAIYSVSGGGWSRFTGTAVASARCSVMLSNTLAASMSRDLVPYIGLSGTANKITKLDDSAVTADSGTTFQAYVKLRAVEPGGPGFRGEVGDAVLLAKAASGVTITATVIPDFDSTLAKTGTALLTATGSETRVTRRLEDSRIGEAAFVEYQIGDASAISNAWSLDRLVVSYSQNDAVGP